jgi:hypothetical protein
MTLGFSSKYSSEFIQCTRVFIFQIITKFNFNKHPTVLAAREEAGQYQYRIVYPLRDELAKLNAEIVMENDTKRIAQKQAQ